MVFLKILDAVICGGTLRDQAVVPSSHQGKGTYSAFVTPTSVGTPTFSLGIGALLLAAFITNTRAQVVSIPDPGLNAAVRAALQIPSAPLTAQDLLALTNLNSPGRNISNLAGLEAA